MSQRHTHHLVTGALGAQGGAIARALCADGQTVSGLARSRPATPLPFAVRQADLADGEAIRRAMQGITHLSVTLPLDYAPARVERYAANLAAAALHAGVERIVFNANVRPPARRTGIEAFDTRSLARDILAATGIPLLTLQPVVYLENLLAPAVLGALLRDGVLHYPLPSGMRVSWISHADLGRAACRAHAGGAGTATEVALGGRALDGAELAAGLGAALGRPLRYEPLPAEAFESALAGVLGNECAAAIAGVYRWAYAHADSLAFSADADAQRRLLALRAESPQEWGRRILAPLAAAGGC